MPDSMIMPEMCIAKLLPPVTGMVAQNHRGISVQPYSLLHKLIVIVIDCVLCCIVLVCAMAYVVASSQHSAW